MADRMVRVTLTREIWSFTQPIYGTSRLNLGAEGVSGTRTARVIRTAVTSEGVEMDIIIPGAVVVESCLNGGRNEQHAPATTCIASPPQVPSPVPPLGPPQPDPNAAADPVLREILYEDLPEGSRYCMVSAPVCLQDMLEAEAEDLWCNESLCSSSQCSSDLFVTQNNESSSASSLSSDCEDEHECVGLPCPTCCGPMTGTFCPCCTLARMAEECGMVFFFLLTLL